MQHILDTLKERGFFAQVTFEEDLYELLSKERVTFYIGFDPTASSLHIGHYIQFMVMAHMQRAGHRPIALIGGGTTMVGDPSGKTDMRPMLTKEEIDENVLALREQMEKFLVFGPNDAFMVNNADWLLDLNYVNFLREIGVHFSVNRMLAAECYKQRLEKGLTFLEFNYMLMQSYDFLMLNNKYGVKLQIGGDDQWSNILSGADLIRRKERKEAFALTTPLLLTHDGKKMGKTEKGAIWLNAEKTTPYEFFQYFRNTDDKDVFKFLSRLTFLPMEEVEELASLPGEQINEAKKRLAYEVTAQIHGKEAADAAMAQAQSLFEGGGSIDAPTTEITKESLNQANRVIDMLVTAGLAKSLGDARRLIAQGGVALNDETVSDAEHRVSAADFKDNGILLRKGKKYYHRIVIKE